MLINSTGNKIVRDRLYPLPVNQLMRNIDDGAYDRILMTRIWRITTGIVMVRDVPSLRSVLNDSLSDNINKLNRQYHMNTSKQRQVRLW